MIIKQDTIIILPKTLTEYYFRKSDGVAFYRRPNSDYYVIRELRGSHVKNNNTF